MLHPNGKPSSAVYDLIGKVYAYIKSCEPYVENATPISQIALIIDPSLGDNPGPSGLGAVRALTELKMQFDVLPFFKDFSQYELLIVPESTCLDKDAQQRLKIYIKNGGAIILSGSSAFKSDNEAILEEQSITVHGECPSHNFIHAKPKDYGHVMYEEAHWIKASENAEIIAKFGEPYFYRAYNNFSGHEYTVEKGLSAYDAIVKNGKVITMAAPLLEAYGKHAMAIYRDLLGNCIRLLIKPMIEISGPSYVSATAVKNENATIVHFLSFMPERRAEGLDVVEDAIPVVDLSVKVRMLNKPNRVYLAPEERDLDFTYENEVVQVKFSFLDGHIMLVLEE